MYSCTVTLLSLEIFFFLNFQLTREVWNWNDGTMYFYYSMIFFLTAFLAFMSGKKGSKSSATSAAHH